MAEGTNAGEEGFSARTALPLLLGTSAKVLIIAALLSEDHHDINVAQIAELAGVHRTTVYDNLDELEELDIVIHTRTVGSSQMYRLNHENPVVKDLKQLEDDLLAVASKENINPTDFNTN